MEEVKEETQLPPGFRFHPTDEELITFYLVNKINDVNFTGRAIADVDLNKSEPWDLPGKAKMGGKEWYFFSLRDRKYPTGQDEWVVCRIFQKSVGLKKYPTNQYSRATYSLNNTQNNASIMSSQMMQLPHDHQGFQFAMGRNNNNYMNNHGHEIQDLNNRVIFQSGSSNMINNFPIQPQMSYNIGGGSTSSGAGGGDNNNNYFSISGLNLNLGGGVVASSQPIFRPMPAPAPHIPPQVMSQQEVASSMMANCATTSYGGEMNNANTMNNSVMTMDNCADLDNYWTSY
ncbi:hypothetical protein MTR67_033770 [Solanum verrucosum]|uniref:NAC domain-containing protein n=1 Tax=Solanum verrucosum TaxID=315347 RepID=A0AAF0ZJM5_SOLVR|nr:hypothetical protein MTR67_033770 [Solanum verrucosum]